MSASIDEKTLKMLEWPLVVSLLAARAATEAGRDRCRALEVYTGLEGVSEALRLTTEAKELVSETERFPLGGVRDLRGAIRRLDQGSVLEGGELVAIADTLDSARRLKGFLAEHAAVFPALSALGDPIVPLPNLVSEIRRCFDPSGEVADHASSKLSEIRTRLNQSQGEIRGRLARMLRSHSEALQEAIVTMRGDRFVLPVRSDSKGQVPGIVHDQSATGMTLFIEPMAVVEFNNQITRARLDERDEIASILAMLTEKVGLHGEELRWTLDALAEIDFTHAKARLSLDLDGSAPRLNKDGHTQLYSARHPLLAARHLEEGARQEKVVPIDVALDERRSVVIITGPNTGGKTVSLKTLGLITLMTQAGLHPPVAPGSSVAIYRQLFADIGDEQSLQQNLSTFSGHMRNIVRIIERADHRTLVLLDELGAGTDPQEGAALARTLIEALIERGARLLATTHYGELKLLAFQIEGVANASVEFDLKTLSPTYRLLMGVPGQSNAITIASALGLSPTLAARAREHLLAGRDDASHIIERLESEQHAAAASRSAADRALAEAERLRSDYEAKLARWGAERAELREKERARLEEELGHARAEIAAVTRELQGHVTAPVAQKAHDRLAKLKHRMKSPERPTGAAFARQLMVGEKVFLPRLNQTGVVQTLPDANGEVQLQVGILKISVKASELQPANSEAARVAAKSQPVSHPQLHSPRARHRGSESESGGRRASMELDLRGKMVHEAIEEVETFLDSAMESDLKSVTVIHGAGTGALRAGMREYLRTSPYVASFRTGEKGEGGDGVTVVQLA